ncbi:unnamed protein product [Clavelina lepadiformis]|uniref:Uncharacterized protein n=1 Tax=Clavelina lepadiformis TaxID=159417 RepID=A0ABP0GB32_CLALP
MGAGARRRAGGARRRAGGIHAGRARHRHAARQRRQRRAGHIRIHHRIGVGRHRAVNRTGVRQGNAAPARNPKWISLLLILVGIILLGVHIGIGNSTGFSLLIAGLVVLFFGVLMGLNLMIRAWKNRSATQVGQPASEGTEQTQTPGSAENGEVPPAVVVNPESYGGYGQPFSGQIPTNGQPDPTAPPTYVPPPQFEHSPVVIVDELKPPTTSIGLPPPSYAEATSPTYQEPQ